MAVLPKAKECVLISKGEHILMLKSIEIKRIASRFPDAQGDGKANVLIWTFLSNKKDEDGFREEHEHMTAAELGKENNTRKLLRQMCPDLDDEEIDEMDTDDFKGQKFRARIVHVEKNGKLRAEFGLLEPYVAEKKSKSKDEDLEDVFEEE